jgi:hypothetical protein
MLYPAGCFAGIETAIPGHCLLSLKNLRFMNPKKYPYMSKAQYQAIIGWKIQHVHYTEVDLYPASPRPYYRTENVRLHTVDIALCFSSALGQQAIIYWHEETPMHYSLQLKTGTGKEVAGQRTWEVSDESFWRDCPGQTVTDVEVLHAPSNTEARHSLVQNDPVYVQTLILHFSHGKTVIVSAAELPGNGQGKAVTGTNNLLVTDDETLARKYKLFVTAGQYLGK